MKKYKNFFFNKTIIVTGHTGFKGSWICLILWIFGAKIIGISSYDLGKKSNWSLRPQNELPEFTLKHSRSFGYEYSYSGVKNIKTC